MIGHLITGLFARAFIGIFNLATLLMCSRYLGSGVLGEVSLLILNIAVIQAVAEIYTGSALVYFIPRANVRPLYKNGLIWSVCCVLILAFLFYVFNVGIRTYWLDVLALSALVCITGFHNVILLGRERIRTYYMILLLQPALMACMLALNIFGAKLIGDDPYMLALYVSWTVTFLFSLVFVVREFQEHRHDQVSNTPVEILRKGAVNQLGNLAHILSNRFNYYVIAATAAVGVYAGATSLIESVWVISAAVSPIVLSRVANQRETNNEERFTARLAWACLIVSFLCVIVVWAIPAHFFSDLLGKDFSGVKDLMIWLSPGVLAISYSSIISHYFSGKGKQTVLLAANCCGLAITIAFSHMMVAQFGLKGAALTASAAYGAQSLFLVFRFTRERMLRNSSAPRIP